VNVVCSVFATEKIYLLLVHGERKGGEVGEGGEREGGETGGVGAVDNAHVLYSRLDTGMYVYNSVCKQCDSCV